MQAQTQRRVASYVSGGEDRRVTGASLAVNHDAGVNLQPGAMRQFQIQLHADPHHHQIKLLRIAAVTADPGAAATIFELDVTAAAMHRYALLLMQFKQRLGDVRTHAAHAQCRLALEYRHLSPETPCRSGDLQANPTAADDGKPAATLQRLTQSGRIVPGAQRHNARMTGPTGVRQTRSPTGSDQQLIKLQPSAVAESDNLLLCINGFGTQRATPVDV
ncbi:hypothetical protein D3C81_1367010 [compost metagenome]